MSVKNIIKSISRTFKKSSTTDKIFFALAIVVIVIIFVNHDVHSVKASSKLRNSLSKMVR